MDSPKKPLGVATSATITTPLTVVSTSVSNTITSSAESGSSCGKQKLTESHQNLHNFWPNLLREIHLVDNVEPGNQLLPLARIKKIMKLDEEVKMISSDAPLLFAKAIEIFIQELTLRAWLHTEHNKRRTLQRSDIAMAITRYDQFDFLIDIVPRDEIKVYKKEFEGKSEDGPSGGTTAANGAGNSSSTNGSEDMQYFFQLSQQHQKVTLQHATKGSIGALTNGGTVFDLATVIGATGSQQLLQAATTSTMATAQQEKMLPTGVESHAGVSTPVSTFQQLPSSQTTIQTASGQSIILANGSATAGGVPNGNATTTNQLLSANQSLQLLQHVMTPTGEIAQIPLNFIRTAGSGGTPNTGQPIFIHTAPMQAAPTIIHTGPTGIFLSANQFQQLQQQQVQQQQQNHLHQTQHQHQSQLQNNHQQQRD